MAGFAYQIVIASTAAKVWEALTDATFTKAFWFGRAVNSDWKPGSPVRIVTPEGGIEMQGTVLEAEAPRRLSYSWRAAGDEGKEPTTVVFELEETGPLVKLSILHDIDAADAKFRQAAAGWTFILCGLKTWLETGKPMPALPWRKS